MNLKQLPSSLRRPLIAGGVALACGGALLLGYPPAAKADFAIKPNDRVVFYGDSITEQRLYTTFAETYIVTRYPQLPVTFVHSGWGGDRVTGGGGGGIDIRLKRDVLAYKPTVMTIMLGMNDAGYRPFDQGLFDTYSKGMVNILDTVKKSYPDVRFTLIQPSPYDDVTRPPGLDNGRTSYNEVLQRYAAFDKATAQERNLLTSDFNTPVNAMLTAAKATNADLSQKIIPDRIHPGAGGHLIMAEALLKTWGATPLVSNVEIDANGGKVVQAQNTKVSNLKTGATLTWTQNDNCLPFPIDMSVPEVALAVNSSDIVQALNQEPLKVTGLTAPRYTLSIDGEDVGDFTREELAQGVNLATLQTPMRDQAMNVHRLTIKHNDQHFWRWREIQMRLDGHINDVMKSEGQTPKYGPELTSAEANMLKALDNEEAGIVAQQRAMAQPKPHQFALAIAPQLTTNLALNKAYVVSDPNTHNFGYGALTDGSWETNGQHTFATNEADTFPKTATIDLGTASQISQVRIGVPGFGSTKTVIVSVSADGQNFTEVGRQTFSFAVERKKTFKFAPVSARYIRLTYPDHYQEEAGYSANFSFTSEVEAYGPVA